MTKHTAKTHPLYGRWRYIQDCQSNYNTRDSQMARKLKLGCDWNNFKSFREDIESHLGLPKPGQQLTRKNMLKGWHLNNLHYCSQLEKAQLQRGLTYWTYRGQQYTLRNLARRVKINYYTLFSRIERGWSIEQAVKRTRHYGRKKKV